MLDLTNKTVAEKSDLKASVIATLTPKGKFTSGDIQVEIIAVSKIREGVELFAKAWKGKKQIGFGADGSVEIERFMFHNPPVMVPDGTFREVEDVIGGKSVRFQVKNFKYDPAVALKTILEDTVKLVGKTGTEIQNGKVGKTTAVFYPAAGANNPCDGILMVGSYEGTWADIRNINSATPDVDKSSSLLVYVDHYGDYYDLCRSGFCFNTATLTSGAVISEAILSIYNAGGGDVDTSPYKANPRFVAFTPAATDNFSSNDFLLTCWGTTSLVTTEVALNTFNSASGYVDFGLNSTGLANINKTGVSVFGCRPSCDLVSSAPTAPSGCRCYYADESGTTSDPKLTVTYTVASFPQLIMVT